MAANSLKNRTNDKEQVADKVQAKELEQPQEQVQEREQVEGSTSKRRKRKKKSRVRRFPIWMRILTVFVLLVLSLVVGLIVGYGVIGDGSPLDALHKDTWQHIIDIVKKNNN